MTWSYYRGWSEEEKDCQSGGGVDLNLWQWFERRNNSQVRERYLSLSSVENEERKVEDFLNDNWQFHQPIKGMQKKEADLIKGDKAQKR